MEKLSCDVCTNKNPQFILNCGCSLCSNCYEVVKSFIEEDNQKCYVCDKDIILSMTLDISKKNNILNQITKFNSKENNDIILSKLKVRKIKNIKFKSLFIGLRYQFKRFKNNRI